MKCWKDLTEKQESDLESVMGKHNARLAREFVKYCDNQRSAAAYVLQLYASEASTGRADASEKKSRIAVSISLATTTFVLVLGFLNLGEKNSFIGGLSLAFVFVLIVLIGWVLFYHRIKKWLAGRKAKNNPA